MLKVKTVNDLYWLLCWSFLLLRHFLLKCLLKCWLLLDPVLVQNCFPHSRHVLIFLAAILLHLRSSCLSPIITQESNPTWKDVLCKVTDALESSSPVEATQNKLYDYLESAVLLADSHQICSLNKELWNSLYHLLYYYLHRLTLYVCMSMLSLLSIVLSVCFNNSQSCPMVTIHFYLHIK